jgi:NAD(P)-dependent dehydrogenase (short-subunit alcohol dehydrogenase family)
MIIRDLHIVVTGAASGLGEATARHLSEAGARVTVLDRDEAGAARVARDIGGRSFAVDVTDPEAGRVVALAVEAAGPIRGLVSCAGIGTAARIVARGGPVPLDAFERVVRVNLIGSFNMLRLVAAQMADSKPLPGGERGAIVNTASVAAFDGQVGQAAYAASKGGIVSMALPAAAELARFGIRVNTIAPGIFDTPLLQELPDEVRATIAASIPFPPRLGDPREFAATVRHCLENAYLNAEVIRLDGGARLPPR